MLGYHFREMKKKNVRCVGVSGKGTAAYYTAATKEGIRDAGRYPGVLGEQRRLSGYPDLCKPIFLIDVNVIIVVIMAR